MNAPEVWTEDEAAELTRILRWGTDAERERALAMMDDAEAVER